MISGIIFIIFTVFFFLYFLLSKSQSMIELRSLVKSSIFSHKTVDLFPTSQQFSDPQKPIRSNVNAIYNFHPQTPLDFSEALRKVKEPKINSSDFLASQSDFIRKPIRVREVTKKKDKKHLQSPWNPQIASYNIIREEIAPRTPIYPEEIIIEDESTPSSDGAPSIPQAAKTGQSPNSIPSMRQPTTQSPLLGQSTTQNPIFGQSTTQNPSTGQAAAQSPLTVQNSSTTTATTQNPTADTKAKESFRPPPLTFPKAT